MKVTKKLSPILLAVVAVVVGCSMIGAATTVMLTQSSTSVTATVGTYPVSITAAAPTGSEGGSDVTFDTITPDTTGTAVETPEIGTVYGTDITMATTADLNDLHLYLYILNTGSDLMTPSDVSVQLYFQGQTPANACWYPVSFESFGDYMLADIPLSTSQIAGLLPGVSGTNSAGTAVPSGFSMTWTFALEFSVAGTYDIEWYAVNSGSVVSSATSTT